MVDAMVGARIRSAREAAGLSQQELAERIGYSSAGTISYLESGERRITVSDIQKLAHALGRPLEYFLQDVTLPDIPKQLSLRASALPPNARKSVSEFFALIQTHGGKCPPRRPDLSRRSPAVAAVNLLRESGITAPPIEPSRVARDLGLKVVEWAFPEEISGILVCFAGNSAIGINAAHHPVRQRFSIAHEIGHFVFGKDHDVVLDYVGRERGFSFDTTVTGDEEVKANRFAANLLMPESWVRADAERLKVQVEQLAKRYSVSEQAMWFRLVNLGIVQETRE